ncbi:hypothetical protein KLP28_00010 [Nocardioidaceae bacterium]|nr:hypothetical protein KLP28_00010 [Nocardioidaceae bacterium]
MTPPGRAHLTWDEPRDPIDGGDGWAELITNDLDDLDEIRRLRAEGWEGEPLQAPAWEWLWILWPRSHRAFVLDRRVRFAVEYRGRGTEGRRALWPAKEYAEVEWSANSSLAELGLPARPAGHIWLLRPPAAYADLDAALSAINRMADEGDVRLIPWPGLLEPMQRMIADLFAGDPGVRW